MSYPTQVDAVAGGNKRMFGFLAGQVLKLSSAQGISGQLSPSAVSTHMMEVVEKRKAELEAAAAAGNSE